MGTAEEIREIRKLMDEIEPVHMNHTKRAHGAESAVNNDEWSKTFGFTRSAPRSEKAAGSADIQKEGWDATFGLPAVSVYPDE